MKYLVIVTGVLMFGIGSAKAQLTVGQAAPDFTAASSDGRQIHLQDILAEAPIVLYFYPKDDTPGCTKEACSLRDDFAAFRNLKALVFGISYDSIESHQAFIKKYHLPFALLSDPDHTIAKLYGAEGTFGAKRMTFIVNKAGRIAWLNPSVSPATHSRELQDALASLQTP